MLFLFVFFVSSLSGVMEVEEVMGEVVDGTLL